MVILTMASVKEEEGFAEIVGLTTAAQHRALLAVNTTLIDLYWTTTEGFS